MAIQNSTKLARVLSMLKKFTRIPSLILVGLVRGYQLLLSPLLPPSCRYTPSCSQYTILALKKYGAIKGTILSVHRILRCNPWGGHGYDPPQWYGESIEHEHLPAEE